MAEPLVSADKKYYAAKEPLVIRGTREGRKTPRPNPSYKQKPADTTASADKYYKPMRPLGEDAVAPAPPATKSRPKVIDQAVELPAAGKVLVTIIQAIQAGANDITLKGVATDIVKARAAVDMAVGRNTLTREQADFVSYITVLPPSAEGDGLDNKPEGTGLDKESESKTPKKKTPKKKTPKKKTTAKKSTKKSTKKKKADDNSSATSEADAILNPPADDDDGDVTEDDIADAFGLNDETNDDSDETNDDSDETNDDSDETNDDSGDADGFDDDGEFDDDSDD